MFDGVGHEVAGAGPRVACASADDAAHLATVSARVENQAAAAKVIAVGRWHAERFARVAPEVVGLPFSDLADKAAVTEISTTLSVSRATARAWVNLAALLQDMPVLRAAFLAGDIGTHRVSMIAHTIAGHTPEVRAEAQSAAVRWHADGMGHSQIRDRLDELCIALDPEQAARDREEFTLHQDVRVRPDRHGHATVDACVPAVTARTWQARITALTGQVCPQDPRTPGQLRVAALATLIDGHTTLACHCGRDQCPSAYANEPGADAQAPATTLVVIHSGDTTVPHIDGMGPIDPELAQALSTGAVIQTASAPTHSPAHALCYAPTAALRERLAWLDGGCRFPGCDHPPQDCELDHQHPFDHATPARGGPTTATNLAHLCVPHHQLKTAGLWHARMHPDRTITWTNTTTGQQFQTFPRR